MHLYSAMKKLICLFAATAALLLSGHVSINAQQAYAFGSVLEVQGSCMLRPYTLSGEQGSATGFFRGADFGLRYTYYPGRHWGFFFSMETGYTNADENGYFKTMNKADGNKYKYAEGHVQYGDGRYYTNGYYNSNDPILLTGAAYRYDFGQWSLRPRVGIGMACFVPEYGLDFTRFDRKEPTGQPNYYSYSLIDERPEYLANPDRYAPSRNDLSFATFAGLQMAYTFRHHVFISAEVGYKYVISPKHYQYMVYGAKPLYNPQNWAQAVYDSNKIGKWQQDPANVTETPVSRCACSLVTFSFGIGWHIGWNRYERNFYNR